MNWNDSPDAEATDLPEDSKRGFLEALFAPWVRFFNVFFSPGQVMSELAREPRWAMSLFWLGVLSLLGTQLYVDALVEFQLEAAAQNQGSELPSESFLKVTNLAGAFVALWFVVPFFTLFYWLAFKVLGDQGSYKHWLSVMTHATVISIVLAIVTSQILEPAAGQPPGTARVSLGLLVGAESGFLANFLNGISLEAIWSTLVVATGAAALPPARRSFGSAAFVCFLLALVVVAIGAGLASLFDF